MSTVGIVDYGLGNLTSVAGAVRKLGHDPVISQKADELAATDRGAKPAVAAAQKVWQARHGRNLRRAPKSLAVPVDARLVDYVEELIRTRAPTRGLSNRQRVKSKAHTSYFYHQ